METENIDKLFLELSQFTKAKTKRELELEAKLQQIVTILGNLFDEDNYELPMILIHMRNEAIDLIEPKSKEDD